MYRREPINVRNRVLRFLRSHPQSGQQELESAWVEAVLAAQPRNDRWRRLSGAKLLSLYRASLDRHPRLPATFQEDRDWLTDHLGQKLTF